MKLSYIIENLDYNIIQGNTNIEISSITIDSRNVSSNSLFVCISGLKTDGHSYIKSAYEKGAAAVICEKDIQDIPKNLTVIRVDNSRKALAEISSKFYDYPSTKFNLIGVTGTNGKTSSTYFMESILNEINHKTGVIGTIDIRINSKKLDLELATSTTPDTVELNKIFSKMAEEKVDDVIMEVSSHALELYKVDNCNFDIGIFTNLTQDHLDFHKTMDNYCKAKSRLFKMCKYGLINSDDSYSKNIIENSTCKIITFGINNKSDIMAKNIEYLMDMVKFDVYYNNEVIPFELHVPGKFSVYNALGVIGAAIVMNIPFDIIQKGINNIKGVPGRIQNIQNDKGFNVIVDYAHTPDSLENIIKSVKEFTKGKVITVFGCGGDRDRKKRPIMGEISAKYSDYTILTSDNPRSEQPIKIIYDIEEGLKNITNDYKIIEDRHDAIYTAINIAKKGDSVIIAGKGHENYEIFADRTIHFDDSEVAKEALEDLK